jgi:ABC-2 type transport system permease protein
MTWRLFLVNLWSQFSGVLVSNGKRTKLSKILVMLVLFGSGAGAIAIVFLTCFEMILKPFYEADAGWLYFAFLGLASFGLSVVSTIFMASARIFSAHDNEMLLAMPIKPRSILVSRVLVLLLFEYVTSMITIVPAFMDWVYYKYSTGPSIAMFFLMCLLLPLMSFAISLAVAWGLSRLGPKVPYKNLITLAIAVAIILGYVLLMTEGEIYFSKLLDNGVEIADAFKRILMPFYSFGRAIVNVDFVAMLEFCAWSLLPFLGAVALLSRSYGKIMTEGKSEPKIKYKEKSLKSSRVIVALAKKEIALFWSNPMIVLNTSLGTLFALVGAFGLVFQREEIFSYITTMKIDIPAPAIAAIFFAFVTATITYTSSSISLEGNSLWIARSMPVKTRTVLLSKVLAQMMINSPVLLLSSLIACIALGATIDAFALAILVPQAAILFISFFGVITNLLLPKLDWINPMQVAKQGIPVLIVMFSSIALMFVLGIFYVVFLSRALSFEAYLFICVGIYALLSLAMYGLISTWGVKVFERL